ncbi:helix-turn-helix domain-containing protein [Nitrososphaera sp. AFS]|jgi:hypothetical protein|uniref:helix-turn-helix domain-containing protein n=1 Tax=Nitrososphaera sp. AFS TaxID=2301191 RepID=UPI0013923DC1|nr:helix-turn-helix domain-containing protein [Nitrososphaera sp. AFS]NAL78608.1 hypothetical protein [Nitrososphaera sp. AFS]
MPPAIGTKIREQVIKEWLEGHTRDKIAEDNQIGTGTVTDIVSEWRKEIDDVDYESVRELSICCRRQGINLGALSSSVRLDNYISKLGTSHEHIESLISFITKSQEPQRLLDLTNQMARTSSLLKHPSLTCITIIGYDSYLYVPTVDRI